jgi:lipoate-protein ligase B
VENRKLGSIGIAVRHGISYHGFALNIDLSLKPFGWIAPCGLEGVVMTTLAAEAGRTIRVEDVHEVVVDRIPCVFGVKIQKMSVGQFAQDFGMRDDLSGESFLTTAPKRV